MPDSLLGKELAEEQRQKLEKRKTIYVTGIKEKKVQEFNAYVKIKVEKENSIFINEILTKPIP